MLCCSPAQNSYEIEPALKMAVVDTDSYSATLSINTINATEAYVMCKEAGADAPTAKQLKSDGICVTETKVVLTGLDSQKNYVAYAVAADKKGHFGKVMSVNFRTIQGVANLYDWEANRKGLLKYDNLDLCYGGSAHRVPFKWNEDRWRKQVFYTDQNGQEHWLFDAFLCIEFVMTQDNMSLNIGQQRTSGTKESWQGLIDYWFDSESGLSALNKVVGEGYNRLGYPGSKRQVVMVIPDPIPYKEYADMTTSTIYWGTLDGQALNFAIGEDRLKAMKWYIDQVRERWSRAGYENLELSGFYCVSEDLAIPGHGWCPELKHWEDIYPAITKYLHSASYSMSWIPYYKAGAYECWKDFQLDYVMMQPNYFWGWESNHPTYSMTEYKNMVNGAGISMELEMDDAMLARNAGSDAYRARFREYMALCKELGLYGTRELSYYMGGDSFYNLATSRATEDVKMYHEFCEFLIGHSQARKANR